MNSVPKGYVVDLRFRYWQVVLFDWINYYYYYYNESALLKQSNKHQERTRVRQTRSLDFEE